MSPNMQRREFITLLGGAARLCFSYIREFDRATMMEIAPHCYLNETAERTLRLYHASVTRLKHHEDKHDDDPIEPIERVTQMAKQFSDSTKHSDISAESTNSIRSIAAR
jgi:hypothetical protein